LKTGEPNYFKGIRENESKIVTKVYENLLFDTVSWVKRNGGGQTDGEEIFSEALLVITSNIILGKINETTHSFGAYLFGISKNLWYKEIEKRKKRDKKVKESGPTEYTSKADFENIIENMVDGHRWTELKERTFNLLTEKCKQVLTLYISAEKPSKIARLLQIEVNAVYRRRDRCGKEWRKLMENDSDFKNCNPFRK